MTSHFDDRETRAPDAREQETFDGLRKLLAGSLKRLPALASWLGNPDPASLVDRAALASLPVLRKPDLMAAQEKAPPFGGFAAGDATSFARIFMSPGPIWEPQGEGDDPWSAARAFYAAGFRAGDIVHNALSYQMTPGGFILDHGARALGCAVYPAGVGNTEAQVDAIAALRAVGYAGTPDYLKVLLDKAAELGRDVSSLTKALVSGGALFPSLRAEYQSRGVAVLQAYATADLGVIAYETIPDDGLIVNENMIVEIVRPGTGTPVADGEVGELVVTTFKQSYPLIRFGTGDLSALLPGQSSCGRTNMRLKGWMGRADQRTKVKGMFVDPKQVAEIVAAHPEISRARLVVSRAEDADVMTLLVEPAAGAAPAADGIAKTLTAIAKLRGTVEIVAPSSLPNDGKVIADERDYSA
jgi:phenylacetate-CoA ligase